MLGANTSTQKYSKVGSEEESGGSPLNSRDKKNKTAHFTETSGSADPSHFDKDGVPHKRGYSNMIISTSQRIDD